MPDSPGLPLASILAEAAETGAVVVAVVTGAAATNVDGSS